MDELVKHSYNSTLPTYLHTRESRGSVQLQSRAIFRFRLWLASSYLVTWVPCHSYHRNYFEYNISFLIVNLQLWLYRGYSTNKTSICTFIRTRETVYRPIRKAFKSHGIEIDIK